MTESQRGLWAQCSLDPDAFRAYNISHTIRLRGQYDHLRLHWALQTIVDRHEALRTRIAPDGENQVISARIEINLPLVDLMYLPAPERENEARKILEESAARPFDIANPSLFRTLVLKIEEKHHLLLLTLHHVVGNGPSFLILLSELCALYEGRTDLTTPMQLSDFVRIQPNLSNKEDEAFWLTQLGPTPPQLELPLDYRRPRMRSFRGHRSTITLDAETCTALRKIGAVRGCSLFTVFFAVFTSLLHRLTGQDEIVVGTSYEGSIRKYDGGARLFANTTNLLPLRSQIRYDTPFADHLRTIKSVISAGSKHKEYFFGRLFHELDLRHDPAYPPLFSVLFNYFGAEFRQNAGGLYFEAVKEELPYSAPAGTAMYDLSFDLIKKNGGIEIRCDYRTDLLKQETVQRWLETYQRFLSAVLNNSEAPISELPILSDSERQQIIVEWNKTTTAYRLNRCVHELFHEQAARTPEAIATVYKDRSLTYEELDTYSNQIAHYLRHLGVGPKTLVAVCLERSLEMIVSLLGILKAGGAYVPLDVGNPKQRLASMLRDTRASLVLSQEKLREALTPISERLICVDTDWPHIAEQSTDPLSKLSAPNNLAYVIYTSGSSGQPKGVLVEHAGLINLISEHHQMFGERSGAKISQVASAGFDAMASEVWPTLAGGATLHIASDEIRSEPVRLQHWLIENKISITFQPTIIAEQLLALAWPEQDVALRILRIAGDRFKGLAAGRTYPFQIYNLYGPTEDTVWTTAARVTTNDDSPGSLIGRPIANHRVYVLDSRLHPVPVGVPGELCIGGVGLARGYLNQPELTAEKFVTCSFDPDGRLYRTGDLARWRSDGTLEFLGRTDRQIKLRGFRIEPGEIELALKNYPATRDAFVMLHEDTSGEKQLVAYVAGEESDLNETNLHNFLETKFPHYMIPSAFVLLDKLPLNSNGKIDRHRLPNPLICRDPEGIVAPRDELESTLVAIWEEVLGIKPIGITDNFFALGGHSLLAVRVINRLDSRTGRRLSLASLFETKTIARLAEKLKKLDLATAPLSNKEDETVLTIPCVARTEESDGTVILPVSFAQQRLWLIDRLRPNSCSYNTLQAFRIAGNLNIEALAHSFSELVHRHEVLRTSIREVNGQPMQCIAPASEVKLFTTDLRGPEPGEKAREENRLIVDEARRPFDLANGPLMRLKLIHTDDTEHVLVITKHHAITDDWSEQVLFRELIQVYEAIIEGRRPDLPELPIQYADFAHWQHSSWKDDTSKIQLGYWREKLAQLPALQLPLDHPRPAMETFSGASEAFELPGELQKALSELGRTEGTTLFITLLAAFKILLTRYTGQEDIVLGCPIVSRPHSQTENLIGFFVNTVVLRTTLANDLTFREVLRQVHATTMEAFEHKDAPFDKVVEALAPERRLDQNPLFQVMFVMQEDLTRKRTMRDLVLTPIIFEDHSAKFDLTMSLFEGPKGVGGSLVYKIDLFEAATIRRMIRHFQILIEGIAVNPDSRISELPILTESEERQMVIEWNQTEAPFPNQLGVSQLFENRVKQNGDLIAVEHNDRKLSYRQLNGRANQLAHLLRNAGIQTGDLVAICMRRSIELVIGKLAILKAGAAYVPINPEYPAERRLLMLEGVSLILTTDQLVFQFAETPIRIISVDSLGSSTTSPENLPAHSDPESVLAVLYTSGSTGKSKGVAIVHRAVVALVLNTNYIAFDSADAVAFRANICFDVALFEIWGPLLSGGRIVVIDHEVQLSPSTFVREMKEREVTILWITTSLFHLLSREMPTAFSGLRYVFIGGEILDPQCVRTILQHGPPGQLTNVYGPTETTTFSTTHRIESVPDGAKTIPIGKPIANTRIYILDRHRKPVPIGVVGEIYIGGAGVAQGYIRAPELTAERFIADPFSSDVRARLYKTGDLAKRLPDGSIDFLGRADFQVKIRGFRVELGEIEIALRRHPAIRAAMVEVRSGTQQDKQLAAYVAGDTAKLTASEIREFLKKYLPDYTVPSIIVVLESFPINANGKIDRDALAKVSVVRNEEVMVAPRSLLEQQLVTIWEQILGLHPVGINDDFFEIGGDSLLAIRAVNRIQELFNRPVEAVVLWEARTIEKIAERLRQTEAGGIAGTDQENGEVASSGESITVPASKIKILPRVRRTRS